jgi:hypothetical protein
MKIVMTSVRPFKCGSCSKEYYRKHQLSKHLKRKHQHGEVHLMEDEKLGHAQLVTFEEEPATPEKEVLCWN